MGLYDGIGKYFIPVNTFVEASAIYASQKTWDKLNQEQRDVIRAASEKAARIATAKAWKRSQGFVDQMKESGYEILDYTPAERAAMVAHIKKTVWPDLANTIGQETMDKLGATK
jgi:TRAP-type C4-dicarboxylate transport system substrate-binding protein